MSSIGTGIIHLTALAEDGSVKADGLCTAQGVFEEMVELQHPGWLCNVRRHPQAPLAFEPVFARP